MIRAIRQLAQALNAALEAYSSERAMQEQENYREDVRRQRIRDMSDDDLMICGRMWGGEICHPELRRRGLPILTPPAEELRQ